jgi:hypothetical protein
MRPSGSATWLLQGKTQTNVPEIKAAISARWRSSRIALTNDVLGDKTDAVSFPPIKFPSQSGLRNRAEGAGTRTDQHLMHRLEEEDPRSATAAIPDQGAAALRRASSTRSRWRS